MRVLGIMSGTSLDGVDYVICRLAGSGNISFQEHWHKCFPPLLQEQLQSAAEGKLLSHQLGQLHHDLGRFYAHGVSSGKKIELAGLHGQTIFHNPDQPSPATLQLGEPAYLAAALKVPVVSNFRANDLAMRGQGAPLATMFHLNVFAEKGRHIAVNNLGGISNVTSIDWRSGKIPRIMAFDTGPANILMNIAASHFSRGASSFDQDGILASKGAVHQGLLEKWLKHSFIAKRPPKSTGRELFGQSFLQKFLNDKAKTRMRKEDLFATLAEFTAKSIARNYQLHLTSFPDKVILCGGGASNPFLFARIAAALKEFRTDVRIASSATEGWDPNVIEASAFALLAWLSWNGVPGNIPSTTGATKPCILGQLTWPP